MSHRHPERPILIGLWLVTLFGVLQWQHPGFWRGPDAHFREATRLAGEGRTVESLAAITQALRKVPRSADYLRFRGYRQIELGRPEEAADSFSQALELDPESREAALGLASALVATGARADSARDLLAGLAASPSTDERVRIAELYSALGDRVVAVEQYGLALADRPDDVGLIEEIVDLNLALGRWDSVIDHTDRWLAADPGPDGRARALERRAPALRATGRTAESFDAYREIPSPANLPARAELALELERYPEAADLYTELRRAGGGPEVSRALAYALDRAGRGRAADSTYRALLDSGDAALETRFRYAWLLNVAGRHAEAWEIIDPLPRPSADPSILALQARTAVWAERDSDAIALLRVWVSRPRPGSLLAEREARTALLALLDAANRPAEALEHARWLAADRPDDGAAWLRVASLADRLDRPREAEDAYGRAISAGAADRDVYLRLARLRRARDAPVDSTTAAYEAALQRGAAREVEWELVETLVDAGRHTAALERIERAAGGALAAPGRLELAVRAAWGAGRPSDAARFLTELESRRPLTRPELGQLADALRGAGRDRDALSRYRALAESGEADLWETVGDLHAGLDEPQAAAEAYALTPGASGSVRLQTKLARAFVAAGEPESGLAAYRTALRSGAPTADLELEVARAAAAAGQPDTAVAHFLAADRLGAGDHLALELAQNLLAAGRFAEAEPWARRSMAANDDRESRVVLGEILQARGYSDEAESTLLPLVRPDSGGDPDERIFQARVAAARDRHLEAWRLLGEAIEEAPGTVREVRLPDLWLARARSAAASGDVRRAAEGFASARAAGALPSVVARQSRALSAAIRPRAGIPASLFVDDNDIELREARASAELWPGRVARVGVELGVGRLEQGTSGFDRLVAGVHVEDWRPSPSVSISGRLGMEHHDGEGSIAVGEGAARFLARDGSFWGFEVESGTPWTSFRDRDPRRFNRIFDLAAIGPAFRMNRIRGTVDRVLGGRDRRLRVDAAVAEYTDDNVHGSLYAHYQLPLSRSLGAWTMLRPNLYVETFSDRAAAYFSPGGLASLGLGLHGVRWAGDLRLEFEIQPEIRWAEGGGVDPGVFGLGEATIPVGDPLDVRLGVFGYAQGGGYWLLRPFVRATASFGPRDRRSR